MNKKTRVLLILAGIVMILLSGQEEVVTIPKDAIRFRVIANSNQKSDQVIKEKVAKSLRQEVISSIKMAPTLDATRKKLQGNLPKYEQIVANVLQENNRKENFNVDYGEHYFPQKTYKGVVYEEGTYESLVVTLGKGEGKNFWCVLFPPLCLLEGEENDQNKNIEYRSFIKEIIEKYFPKS